jgi:hypothetical protein
MKLLITFLPLSFLFIENIASAFTIRYYNKDSKNYEMEVRSNGSTQKLNSIVQLLVQHLFKQVLQKLKLKQLVDG